MSQPVSRTPDKPDYVTIGFHEGVPFGSTASSPAASR
jgi:hypothetical protein